jgi:hypothetical protein
VALGAWQGLAQLPWDFEAGEEHPRWEGRYATLLSLLEDTPKALFVDEDRPGESRQKLFRAQFVLGPTILQERSGLDKVGLRQLLRDPLILDFGNGPALTLALSELETEAERLGLELSVERQPGALALVRTRKAAKR